MSLSVRMDPLLEMQLEQAARRQGMTKVQFIIATVVRALGRQNPYELMLALQAEQLRACQQRRARAEIAYETDASRAALKSRLSARHRDGGARS